MPKTSSGLLIYRRCPGVEILLVHPGGPLFGHKDEGYWSIPKGEIDPGEDLLAAAKRGFKEETGLKPSGPFVELKPVTTKSGKVNGFGDIVQFFLAHDNDALFMSNGLVTKEPANGSVAENFYVGEQAKIQALKNHARLHEAIDFLENTFGILDAQ